MQYRDAPDRRARGTARRSLARLGRKTLPWYYLLIMVIAAALIAFVLLDSLDEKNRQLRVILDQAEDLVFEKEREVLRLSEQVRLASTDQFIANEARTKYGYLFPGEIRFVVLNPEVLGLPPRAAEEPQAPGEAPPGIEAPALEPNPPANTP